MDPKQCKCSRIRIRLAIGLRPVEGETADETYTKWCRRIGRNPWCGMPIEVCPEPVDGP